MLELNPVIRREKVRSIVEQFAQAEAAAGRRAMRREVMLEIVAKAFPGMDKTLGALDTLGEEHGRGNFHGWRQLLDARPCPTAELRQQKDFWHSELTGQLEVWR